MSKLEHAIFGTMIPSELSDMPYGWNAEEIAMGTNRGDFYQLIRIWPDDEGREGGYNYAILETSEEYDDQEDWGTAEDAIRAGEEMGIRWRQWAPELNDAMDTARTKQYTRAELEWQIINRIRHAEEIWEIYEHEERPRPREIQLRQYLEGVKWAKQMIALYEEEYGEWTCEALPEHEVNN